jgi:SNARE protein 1
MQLNRAQVEVGPSSHERKERDTGAPIKLDAEAQAHIEKHRYAPFVCEVSSRPKSLA